MIYNFDIKNKYIFEKNNIWKNNNITLYTYKEIYFL